MKFIPELDKEFKPAYLETEAFLKAVKDSKKSNELMIALERNDGYTYVYKTEVFADGVNDEANIDHIERIIKSLLWVVGGYKIYLCGSKKIADAMKVIYSESGLRSFDVKFMQKVYEAKFEVIETDMKTFPKEKDFSVSVGGNLDGCRIGFDAGGSDRKVSAVIDGKVVYSEEVVWHPKLNSDPMYHYEGIKQSMLTAASKMPKVDAVGISSAGVYVANRIMAASLFIKVPDDAFDKQVKNMYLDIVKECFGDVPVEVANDGDVTALAGAMDLHDGRVLGIAMGTSEAVGYIDKQKNIKGWLNELAFVPVDFNKNAQPIDEWSGDYGCGVKYFSQDSVIKLAERAGITLDAETPAEKLKIVQKLMENGDAAAKKVYETIGIYLGYSIAYYSLFYDIKHLLILGRVTSGEGGTVIIEKAKEVLAGEFKNLSKINITTPDESNKRVGQSIAAASLPKSK